MSARRRALLLTALLVGSAGGLLLAEQGWLSAKAFVAQRLIRDAFRRHLADGRPHPPWSWADTWPIAELYVPRLGLRRSVLAGASGASMAFGVGHIDGTTSPNGPGNCGLAGHRDGPLAFLERLRIGDTIQLRTHGGMRRYTVTAAEVVSMWRGEVLAPTADRRLTLITCFPFGGLTRSRLRYVVTCEGLETVFAGESRAAHRPDDASACVGTGARPAACRSAPGSAATTRRTPRAR